MKARPIGIDSPAKRARVAPRRNPYWRPVGPVRGGIHLGYRKPSDQGAGAWIGKLVLNGVRKEARLGSADDVSAEGRDILDYSQAVAAALAWAKAEQQAIAGEAVLPADPSLEDILVRYIKTREKRSRQGKDARWRLNKHVLSNAGFAARPLSRITPEALTAWRNGLPAMRPATLNRLLNDLRAALAGVFSGGILPPELRAALKGEADAAEAREVNLLTADAIRRLVDAALRVDPHFGRLILVLAATGARLSQAARITVEDVQPANQRIMVPASAKGRATKARKATACPVGQDVIDLLRPALASQDRSDRLLLQKSGQPWMFSSEMTRPWRRALEQAGLPRGLVPYDLRHSSIVRQLSSGVPIRFVAVSHDTSTAMIERNYSRYITSEVEAAARRAIVSLAPAETSQVAA
jgi:integrase